MHPPKQAGAASLADFVEVYPAVLPADLCEALIAAFAADEAAHEPVAAADGAPIFSQRVITGAAGWEELHASVVRIFEGVVADYRAGFREDWLPQAMGWEALRLKRYRPGTGEHFPLHVDVVNRATARRALAFFAYLDDVDEGGETVFPTLGMGIRPQRGNVLVFPPLWLFPHLAQPVVSEPKHILHSYLHYMD